MKKDIHITEVIFRVDKEGTVFALFPYLIGTNEHNSVTTYQHIGQHGTGDYNHCISTSKVATETEYKDLYNELTNGIGYNLKVIKRRNYDKYMKEYRKNIL